MATGNQDVVDRKTRWRQPETRWRPETKMAANGNKMATTGNQDVDDHNETGTRMAAGCHKTAVRLVPRFHNVAHDVVTSTARDELTQYG